MVRLKLEFVFFFFLSVIITHFYFIFLILAYRKAIDNLENDRKWQTDIAMGKRIGLYKLSGELGKGNFSQVKTGYHELTKGNLNALIQTCKH